LNPLLYNDCKEIEIVYEDDYCIVVNKPNNLLVHHSYFSRNIEEDSLVQLLKLQGYELPIPVHRLDRKTSGLLLLAKDKEFVKPFQELFESQDISKKYVALVRGFVEGNGVIDSPVKNDRGNYKDALTHYIGVNSLELDIPVEPYLTARYSYVEFEPKTGRMHQLRIHSNKISHPIIGDHKYGNRHHNQLFEDKFGLPNLFLHAFQLVFNHPFLEKEISIIGEKPLFWKEFESKIKDFIIQEK
jgi:tRNA pseudouridine65 synthase